MTKGATSEWRKPRQGAVAAATCPARPDNALGADLAVTRSVCWPRCVRARRLTCRMRNL